MTEQTRFATLLKRYRQAAGLSQEALAARAQLSARAISDLERGINRTPRNDTLELLTDALSLSSHQRALLRAAARPDTPAFAVVPSSFLLPVPLTSLVGREQDLMRVVLTRESGGGKLEEVDILHEGKRRCKRHNERLRKSSNWKRCSWPTRVTSPWPRLPVIWALPRVRCTGGVSGSASMVSRPFLAVGINCHTKKRCDGYSERMTCCVRSVKS